jgi:hypothetical protein
MFCAWSRQVLAYAVTGERPPVTGLIPEQHHGNAMQGRALPAEQVLPLLRKQPGELCCQDLEYLVVGCGSQVPEHHTELALSLASAALALMPRVDHRCNHLCLCCTAAAYRQHQRAALTRRRSAELFGHLHSTPLAWG